MLFNNNFKKFGIQVFSKSKIWNYLAATGFHLIYKTSSTQSTKTCSHFSIKAISRPRDWKFSFNRKVKIPSTVEKIIKKPTDIRMGDRTKGRF